jgi:hypothetical protein
MKKVIVSLIVLICSLGAICQPDVKCISQSYYMKAPSASMFDIQNFKKIESSKKGFIIQQKNVSCYKQTLGVTETGQTLWVCYCNFSVASCTALQSVYPTGQVTVGGLNGEAVCWVAPSTGFCSASGDVKPLPAPTLKSEHVKDKN